jgi:hypothetical protein
MIDRARRHPYRIREPMVRVGTAEFVKRNAFCDGEEIAVPMNKQAVKFGRRLREARASHVSEAENI